jgi:hypothetical protein
MVIAQASSSTAATSICQADDLSFLRGILGK